jgi:Undecaprenyl-phosphate galactose phosphotransferase WbaP
MNKPSAIAFAGDMRSRAPARAVRHWAATLILMLSDAAVFALAGLVFRAGRHMPAFMLFHGASRNGPVLDEYSLLVFFFLVVRYLAGDYAKRVPFWDTTRRSTSALLVIASLDMIFQFMMHQTYPWFLVLAMWLLLLPAIPVTRQATKRILSRLGLWKIRTILIAGGDQVGEVVEALDTSTGLGFEVRHVVLTDGSEPETALGDRRLSAIADPTAIARLAANTGCTQAVLAMDDLPRMSEIMQHLIGLNFDITVIPPFRRLPLFGMSTNVFFGKDIVLLQMRNNLARMPSRVMKRVVDLLGSAILLVLCLPVFAALIVLIRRDSPGPAFFIQTRVGRHGREFGCIKFRTMQVDAERIMSEWEKNHPEMIEKYRSNNFKLADDPRVSRVGRWLRRTSLDELPQLVNVLIGRMSLTGPRPLLPREVPAYGTAIELYKRAAPGITGLWQISGRSNTTFRDRVMYDEWYIKNWSMWYDIVIMLRTVRVVLSHRSGAF